MKKRNNILKTVATALAVLGLASADSIAQGPGPAPTTSSAFRMYNSGSNWITIAAGPTAGTGTFLWPAVSEGVFKSDVAGMMSIGQITAADLELTHNSMFVGNATNDAVELAVGTNGQVLQINGGSPTWQTINLLPNGTSPNTTLAWDGSNWVENTNLLADPTTGDVTMGPAGSVTINNADLNLTATPTTGGPLTTENVLIVDPVGNVTETSPDNIVDAATLPLNNLYVGNAANNPQAYAPGTNGQVLQINGGAPTWQTINLLPIGTLDHATLVWDAGSSAWIENTNVTMDNATGDITTIGDVTGVDATFSGADINLTGTLTTAGPLTTENVLIVDPAGNVTETSPDNIVDAATLPQNNIYVGNASNNPQAYAPGSNGDVLTVVGGTPTWSTPTGTIAAKGKVTGSGTWTYTVNPGVDPSGATTVIMVTLTSTSGLQVTHVVNNITGATFDVQFPVNIGGTETIHWMVIQ